MCHYHIITQLCSLSTCKDEVIQDAWLADELFVIHTEQKSIIIRAIMNTGTGTGSVS